MLFHFYAEIVSHIVNVYVLRLFPKEKMTLTDNFKSSMKVSLGELKRIKR